MKKYWESLRPFEKRVVVGVASMLFVVFNFWFVFPHFSDLNRMQWRMQKARDTYKAWQAEIAKKDFYQKEVRKLQGEGADVPPQDQALQFERTLTDEEMKVGITPINSGRITTSTNNPFFLEQSRTIVVRSGEQQLVDFLYNLGSGTSPIRARSMTLHPEPQQRYQLDATLTLVASYQKAVKPGAGTRPVAANSANPSVVAGQR
jgi:hypothetical protein